VPGQGQKKKRERSEGGILCLILVTVVDGSILERSIRGRFGRKKSCRRKRRVEILSRTRGSLINVSSHRPKRNAGMPFVNGGPMTSSRGGGPGGPRGEKRGERKDPKRS